jgi:hypothetical protein
MRLTRLTGLTGPTSGGAAVLSVDGASVAPELITNGTFDSNIDGWTAPLAGSTLTWNAGRLQIQSTVGLRGAAQAVSLEVGSMYELAVDLVDGGGIVSRFGFTKTSFSSGDFMSGNLVSGTRNIFRWTATDASVSVFIRNQGIGTTLFDNMSLRKVA